MKLKFKLISTIASACLVVALLVTGVWAVSTASVTLGGTISFSATNVHARIEGSISGSAETVSITPLEYNSETDESSTDFQNALKTWSNDLTFTDQNKIQMTITVTNLSTERDLFLSLNDNTEVDNLTHVVLQGESAYTSGTEVELVAGTEESKNSVTFNITLKATSTDKSVDGTYGYKVDLRDETANTTPAPTVLDSNKKANGMTFSLSTGGSNTATVEEFDDSVANVVIPAQVTDGTNTYDVTMIESSVFAHLTTVVSIEIPKTVTEISYEAFLSNSINYVIFEGQTPPSFGTYPFYWDSTSLIIYVPDESVETYKTVFRDAMSSENGVVEAFLNQVVGISEKTA